MTKFISIFYNELRLYFFSWLGWSSLIIINLIAGAGFLIGSVLYGNFQNFFSLVEMPFTWAILIVGSRSFARDKELGIFSLFFTAPLKLSVVIFAKFCALASFFIAGASLLLFYPILASIFFSISWMSVISGFLSLIFSIILFSGITLFSSSCTKNTLIAIVIGFGIWIFLNLLNSIYAGMDPNLPLTYFIREISYNYHFTNISSGYFSIADILYFIISTIFMLKITESKILLQIAY